MDNWIVADPEHLGGSPRVRGTRISVALILESLAAGMSIAQIVDAYPSLTEESVRGVLAELAHRKDLQPALRRAATSFCGKFSSSRIFQRRLRSRIGSYATVAGIGQRKALRFARDRFDLCFTRDAGFRNLVRQDWQPARLKLLRVTLQQKPQDEFVLDFISVFRARDWAQFNHGDDWP